MASSAIEQALLLLPLVKSHEKDSGDIVERVIQIESGVGEETTTTGWDGAELIAAPFLAAARQGILPVLEKLGTGMYPVKVDISGNIERLEKALQLLGQVQGSLLFNVVRKELQCNQHTDSKSATKALLWLKRALDFTVGMIKLLVENPEMEVSIAAEMTYTEKLKPFHGWITQGAFSMALRIVPSRISFFEKISDSKNDMQSTLRELTELVDGLMPIIEDIDLFLKKYDLDDPTVV